MFEFLNRSQPHYPTIRQVLAQMGVLNAANPALVSVLETNGQFSGRRVNFFSAFAPGQKDVVLGSGHVERGGMVVLNSPHMTEGATPDRVPADRAAHADDERLVFWDAEAARTSEASLSAPAATWLYARSNPGA